MKKNKFLLFEIMLFAMFLGTGFVLIFRMDVIYREHKEFKLAKLANLEKIKNEKEAMLKETNTSLFGNTENIYLEIDDSKISPNVINANYGDEIVLNIKVNEGYHNINIEFYDVISENIATGNIDELNFVATKSGVFRIYSHTGRYEKPEPEGVLVIQ